MVYEKEVVVIVMLSQLEEDNMVRGGHSRWGCGLDKNSSVRNGDLLESFVL